MKLFCIVPGQHPWSHVVTVSSSWHSVLWWWHVALVCSCPWSASLITCHCDIMTRCMRMPHNCLLSCCGRKALNTKRKIVERWWPTAAWAFVSAMAHKVHQESVQCAWVVPSLYLSSSLHATVHMFSSVAFYMHNLSLHLHFVFMFYIFPNRSMTAGHRRVLHKTAHSAQSSHLCTSAR